MTPQRIGLAGGVVALGAAWLGPLPAQAHHAFWAHMAMHMLVVAVAAPLVAIGVSGTPLDPVRRAPRLFAPIPASLAELAVVWAWHTPVLHEAARATMQVRVVEQSSFLAVGLILWLAAFGGGPALRRSRAGAGAFGLLFTAMHMTLLGVLFAVAPRALYDHGSASMGAALADQHVGGAIMLTIGGASYLAGGLWLTRSLLRDAPSRPGPAT